MAGLSQTTAPSEEPVTLDEARQWCRVDSDDRTQDQVIEGLIVAARTLVEEKTGQQLVTASWQYVLDRFPYRVPGRTWQWPGDVWDRQNASWLEGLTVRLPRPPLQSVTSIQYIDTTGLTQTWPVANYIVDITTKPGRVMPVFGQIWPIVLVTPNAAIFNYVSGYGNRAAVPATFKLAVKLLLGHWWLNREAVGTVGQEIALAFETLIWAKWHGSYDL